MMPLLFILKTFDHRPFIGRMDFWLCGFAVLAVLLIYRKKITAWLKSLFVKKQAETTDTKS